MLTNRGTVSCSSSLASPSLLLFFSLFLIMFQSPGCARECKFHRKHGAREGGEHEGWRVCSMVFQDAVSRAVLESLPLFLSLSCLSLISPGSPTQTALLSVQRSWRKDGIGSWEAGLGLPTHDWGREGPLQTSVFNGVNVLPCDRHWEVYF